MTLIFVPLAVYFYYKAVEDKKYLYALISGILFILVILTHEATPIILFLAITLFTIVLTLLRRDIRFIKGYAAFLLIPVVVTGLTLLILFIITPQLNTKYTKLQFLNY